jgi:hypothetical protein
MIQANRNNRSNNQSINSLRVVFVDQDQAMVEREIGKHVRVIRSLIDKLGPVDKQKYFDGLLSHIIDEPADSGNVPTSVKRNNGFMKQDYSRLSIRELALLEELSGKMEEMYRTMHNEWRH